MDREAREFAGAGVFERIQRAAADDVAVEFGDEKSIDLAFEAIARAAHQHAGSFERTDQFDDAGDVFRGRAANVLKTVFADLRAASRSP